MSKKVRQNEQDLTEKLHNKIPTSYRTPNGYFQQERFQKLVIRLFHYLDRRQKKLSHSN